MQLNEVVLRNPMAKTPSNKQGQELGRKGRETRQRLMDAALALLKTGSPDRLTAAQIAKLAEVKPASFYVYFANVQDLLYDMCEAASREVAAAFEASDLFLDPEQVERDSVRFVEMWNDLWTRHQEVFHYRDMQANYGDRRFSSLVTNCAIPMMDRLFRLTRSAHQGRGGISNIDAYAEAVVLFVAIDRLAAAIHREHANGISPDRLKAAQARILARTLDLRSARKAEPAL